ncbi:hypothetical protein WICPIJ_002356 [Wickerhamomyces pijperi]|uniref:Uncharacterized protein n=1 Tax=Wickerhamomyces pijperi TaxID=599730 RepID=A0A9P8QBN1_WICPI|nr:hypothetical protein WICPIJ_002356 [Wickerhamomyces pijperi]
MTLFVVVNSDSLVVTTSDDFLPGRRVVNVHDSSNVVFENICGVVHVSHIVSVSVVILVTDNEIVGFHWVPTDGVGSHCLDDFLDW